MAKFRDEEPKKPKPKKNISTLQDKDIKTRKNKKSVKVETPGLEISFRWWVN